MWQLQLAAIAALLVRAAFFVATRRYPIRGWLAFLSEVAFLGALFIWADQLNRLDLAIIIIVASGLASSAIAKIKGAWTMLALLLLVVQMALTYFLFAVSDPASSQPGACIWPGEWRETLHECDYL